MSDYNELKVIELKEELKKRGIPTTNLTRKQQIIDRLVQDDEEKSSAAIDNAVQGSHDVPDDAPLPEDLTSPDTLAGESSEPAEVIPKGEAADVAQAPPEQAGAEAPAVEATSQSRLEPIAESMAEAEATAETTAEPVAETTDTAMEDAAAADQAAAEPEVDVMAATTEAKSPETHTEDTTPDSRKRKRRSATPPISQESVNKKLKQAEEDVVHVETEDRPESEDEPALHDNARAEGPTEARAEVEMPDVRLDEADATVQPAAISDDVAVQVKETVTDEKPGHDADALSSRPLRSPKERRYKNLLNPAAAATTTPGPATETAIDSDIRITPAVHPATRALYIRELVRPLNPAALHTHLDTLATPPDADPSSTLNLVEECYVDPLKTHAFVLFTSISAASRARASIHARVWPPEPQRRPLWVDFIPEEKVREWIETERSQGGTRPSQAKRWEVSYTVHDDHTAVTLIEAAPNTASAGPIRQQSLSGPGIGVPGAPMGPRASIPTDRTASFSGRRPLPPVRDPEESSASFLELDKLFRTTATKPKLYWQPVSASLADKRLDEIDRETSRDWDARKDARINGDALGRGLDQLRRYTFEDGDVLVDGGPEFGGGNAFGRGPPPPPFYGGRGGRRGGDRWRG